MPACLPLRTAGAGRSLVGARRGWRTRAGAEGIGADPRASCGARWNTLGGWHVRRRAFDTTGCGHRARCWRRGPMSARPAASLSWAASCARPSLRRHAPPARRASSAGSLAGAADAAVSSLLENGVAASRPSKRICRSQRAPVASRQHLGGSGGRVGRLDAAPGGLGPECSAKSVSRWAGRSHGREPGRAQRLVAVDREN